MHVHAEYADLQLSLDDIYSYNKLYLGENIDNTLQLSKLLTVSQQDNISSINKWGTFIYLRALLNIPKGLRLTT